jgi:hypothetical protein
VTRPPSERRQHALVHHREYGEAVGEPKPPARQTNAGHLRVMNGRVRGVNTRWSSPRNLVTGQAPERTSSALRALFTALRWR